MRFDKQVFKENFNITYNLKEFFDEDYDTLLDIFLNFPMLILYIFLVIFFPLIIFIIFLDSIKLNNK